MKLRRIVDTRAWSPANNESAVSLSTSRGRRRRRRTTTREMSALLATLPTVDVYPAHDINVIFDPNISRVDPKGGRFCSGTLSRARALTSAHPAASSSTRDCDCPTVRGMVMATSVLAALATIMAVVMLARYRAVMGKRHSFIATQHRC